MWVSHLLMPIAPNKETITDPNTHNNGEGDHFSSEQEYDTWNHTLFDWMKRQKRTTTTEGGKRQREDTWKINNCVIERLPQGSPVNMRTENRGKGGTTQREQAQRWMWLLAVS